jgi:hypothetical protein
MSHRLMRIAILVMVAGSAIALSGPIAFGQPSKTWDTSSWRGSATCTVTAYSLSHRDYTNQETHKWEIIPILWSSNSLYLYYWAKWTVTGSGRNADFSWTTNGLGWVILQFGVSSTAAPGIGSGLLNIAEAENSPNDLFGTTVQSNKDGSLSKVPVAEWQFPDVYAQPGAVNCERAGAAVRCVLQGSPNPPLPPTTGAAFVKEPSDGTNFQSCSWDFEYQPVLLKPLPGKLCLPDMPDCDKPFVLKPPLKKPD